MELRAALEQALRAGWKLPSLQRGHTDPQNHGAFHGHNMCVVAAKGSAYLVIDLETDTTNEENQRPPSCMGTHIDQTNTVTSATLYDLDTRVMTAYTLAAIEAVTGLAA